MQAVRTMEPVGGGFVIGAGDDVSDSVGRVG